MIDDSISSLVDLNWKHGISPVGNMLFIAKILDNVPSSFAIESFVFLHNAKKSFQVSITIWYYKN